MGSCCDGDGDHYFAEAECRDKWEYIGPKMREEWGAGGSRYRESEVQRN